MNNSTRLGKVSAWPALLALISCTVALASCGSEQEPYDPAAAQAHADEVLQDVLAERASRADSTPSTASATFRAVQSVTAQAEQADDTQSDYRLEVGQLSRAADPKIPAGYSLEACELDTGRDAVVPFRFSATNSTDGFESLMLPLLSFGDAKDQDVTARIATTLDGAPYCREGSLQLRLKVQPGATSVISGTLVLANYYSPTNPDGDSEALESFVGSISGVSCLTAPGAVHGVFRIDGGLIDPTSEVGNSDIGEC